MNELNEQEPCKDPLCSPVKRRINTADQIKTAYSNNMATEICALLEFYSS